jgi:hypothetical protein
MGIAKIVREKLMKMVIPRGHLRGRMFLFVLPKSHTAQEVIATMDIVKVDELLDTIMGMTTI